MQPHTFAFLLGTRVQHDHTKGIGVVIGAATFLETADQFMVRWEPSGVCGWHGLVDLTEAEWSREADVAEEEDDDVDD